MVHRANVSLLELRQPSGFTRGNTQVQNIFQPFISAGAASFSLSKAENRVRLDVIGISLMEWSAGSCVQIIHYIPPSQTSVLFHGHDEHSNKGYSRVALWTLKWTWMVHRTFHSGVLTFYHLFLCQHEI